MNAPASAPTLAPGSLVGGRFEVRQEVAQDALGVVLEALDTKTKKSIALRVLHPGILDAEGVKLLRKEARLAASIGHKNVAATYGVGADPSGAPFIASEWVGGRSLDEVIASRRASGGHMSLKGAYNVISHVCRALAAASPKTSHGALHPGSVCVTEAGRVKVTDFALGKSLLAARGARAFSEAEQACLAPEVKTGQPASTAGDIFGVGAILYLLLTGKSPADGFVPPSQAHPDATEAIDKVLLRCLAADPAARYGSPDEVRSALQPLVDASPAPPSGELPLSDEVSVEVDIELDSLATAADAESPGAPSANAAARTANAAPPSASAAPQIGQRVSMHEPFRPSLVESPKAPAAAAEVDLGQMLAKITENDAPRWMVVKDGLDHGPFSGRELVDHIVKGEILEAHALMNMDTGERKPISEWAEFGEFVEQQKLRFEEQRKQQALQSAEVGEKRSGMAKIAIAAGILVMLAIGTTAFLLGLQDDEDDAVTEADLGDLYERGEIEIEGTAGILPDPPRGRRRGMGGARRTSMGGFVGSYEDAMNVAVELGDLTAMGGQQRLSPGTVQGTMNRHINRLYNGCVTPELRRGGSLSNVTIDIAIAGSGAVMGVSARQGSGAFKSCIRGAVRRVRFPSFGAPRMGARYSFGVD